MANTHTPGPWHEGSHRSVGSQSGTICDVYSHMGSAEANANQRLIAAAPELLAALEWIANQPTGSMYAEVREAALSALEKAGG